MKIKFLMRADKSDQSFCSAAASSAVLQYKKHDLLQCGHVVLHTHRQNIHSQSGPFAHLSAKECRQKKETEKPLQGAMWRDGFLISRREK